MYNNNTNNSGGNSQQLKCNSNISGSLSSSNSGSSNKENALSSDCNNNISYNVSNIFRKRRPRSNNTNKNNFSNKKWNCNSSWIAVAAFC